MNDGYTIVSDGLCAVVGADAAIIAGKVVSMCGENEQCEISLKYLSDILGVSIDQVRRYISKLQALGYIEYIPRNGRGILPIFKKGANMQPFMSKKGSKNAAEKVAKMQPNNIDNNIIVCLDNAPARTLNKQNKQTKKKIMEDFNIFWQAFFFGSYAKYEREQEAYKERAQSVWSLMTDAARESCIKELRNGKRYDKTTFVVYYLQHYQEPLRIWYDGDSDLTPQLVGQLVRLKYKERWAYCLPEDADKAVKAGAVIMPR